MTEQAPTIPGSEPSNGRSLWGILGGFFTDLGKVVSHLVEKGNPWRLVMSGTDNQLLLKLSLIVTPSFGLLLLCLPGVLHRRHHRRVHRGAGLGGDPDELAKDGIRRA